MFDRAERHCKKLIEKAMPITKEQYTKLVKLLMELGLPYTAFYTSEEGSTDDKVIQLSNDTFIVKDYFGE